VIYLFDSICFCISKIFLKKNELFLFSSLLQINNFLMFSDHFDTLISKIIFKKIYYFDIFISEKHFKK
jgi:hypothetical protein